jgi:NADPH-ferrihemoprotein reductase
MRVLEWLKRYRFRDACNMTLTMVLQQSARVRVDIFIYTSLIAIISALILLSRVGVWRFLRASGGSSTKSPVPGNSRCIIQKLQDAGKDCVVFYGSQTGNSQDMAEKLAKEGHGRFGLETMAADLDEYDYDTLVNFSKDKIAIFVLSSYGEGEPTDNAVGFFEFITGENPAFSDSSEGDQALQNMKYAAFGLGNSTYEHYNAVMRKVDKSFTSLGAKRIGPVGEGDDAQGTTEDSFIAWKEAMWKSLCEAMNLDEHETKFEPSFIIKEQGTTLEEQIYLGERSKDELLGIHAAAPGPSSPVVVRILNSRELYNSQDRNCIHMELDLGGSGLRYKTGDHVAVWPMNADLEVERFLQVFGFWERRHSPIHISAVDSTSHAHIPTPTTYDAAVRYYMDIAGPTLRQSLAFLADFAKDEEHKSALLKLNKDSDEFRNVVSNKFLNLAQVIEIIHPVSPVRPLFTVPFAVLLECVKSLQPRYYSISSSSLLQKESLSITAVVEAIKSPEGQFKGVASNFLLAQQLAQHQQNETKHTSLQASKYALSGPRGKYNLSFPIHIRASTFRLPSIASKPIIMIGPGTGVAPFRAFMHERVTQAQSGVEVGDSTLFYGCRKVSEDFMYQDEWKVSKFWLEKERNLIISRLCNSNSATVSSFSLRSLAIHKRKFTSSI